MREYIRKVQKIGRASLFITLPKAWVKMYGVNEGDSLYLKVADDGSLIINREEAKGGAREAVIDTRGRPIELVKKELVYAYLNGYASIRVIGEEREVLRELKRFAVGRLEGLIVVKEEEGENVFSFIIDYGQVKYREIVERANRILSYMCEDIENVKVVRSYEDELNRLYFLSVRVLREALINPEVAGTIGLIPIEILDHRLVLHLLESLGDELMRAAGKVSRPQLSAFVKYKDAAVNAFLFGRAVSYEELMAARDESLKSMKSGKLEKFAHRLINIVDDIVDLSIRPGQLGK